MQSKLIPYLSFKDNARDAMEFYKSVFGGKLEVNTFKESDMSSDPSEDNKVMHAMLEADNGITLMAADTPASMTYVAGANISMSLSGNNDAELREYWDKLSSDAAIQEPLVQAPWGATFGMLTDKFGVHWMVNIASSEA